LPDATCTRVHASRSRVALRVEQLASAPSPTRPCCSHEDAYECSTIARAQPRRRVDAWPRLTPCDTRSLALVLHSRHEQLVGRTSRSAATRLTRAESDGPRQEGHRGGSGQGLARGAEGAHWLPSPGSSRQLYQNALDYFSLAIKVRADRPVDLIRRSVRLAASTSRDPHR